MNRVPLCDLFLKNYLTAFDLNGILDNIFVKMKLSIVYREPQMKESCIFFRKLTSLPSIYTNLGGES